MVNIFWLLILHLAFFPHSLYFVNLNRAIPLALVLYSAAAFVTALFRALFDFNHALVLVFIWFVAGAMLSLVKKNLTRIFINFKQRDPIDTFLSYLYVVSGLLLLYRMPPPLGWDARSIWLFKPSWFMGDSQLIRDTINDPAVSFAHPEYPPLIPGSIAGLWQISGVEENLTRGLAYIALFSLAGVALLTSYTAELIKHLCVKNGDSLSWFALIMFPIGLTLAGTGVTTGYVDPASAVYFGLVVVMVALLLIRGMEYQHGRWMLLIFTIVAIGIKQENAGYTLPVILTIICIGPIRKKSWQIATIIFMGITPLLFWLGVLKALDFEGDLATSGLMKRLYGNIISFDSYEWHRIGVLISEYGRAHLLLPLIVGLLTFSFAAFFIQAENRKVLYFILITWLSSLVVVIVTYGFGNPVYEIRWWLLTSFGRILSTWILITGLLVLLSSMVVIDRVIGSGKIQPLPLSENLTTESTD